MNLDIVTLLVYKILGLVVNVTTIIICLKRRLSLPLTIILFFITGIISVIVNYASVYYGFYLPDGIVFVPLMLFIFKDNIFRKLFAFFAPMFVSIAIFNFLQMTFGFFVPYGTVQMYMLLIVFLSITFSIYFLLVLRYGKKFLNMLFGDRAAKQWILFLSASAMFYIMVLILEKFHVEGSLLHYGMVVFMMWCFFILCYAIVKSNSELDMARKIYEAEIERLDLLSKVHYDPLTGIYNRRYLDENLDYVMKLLSRTGGNISIFMMDIDFFKKYNDTYGHKQGDECLKAVAKALSDSLTRESDYIARYGGEEFIAVLSNTDEKGASLVAEKMLNNIRALGIPHEKSDIAEYVSISIGATSGTVLYTHNAEDYVKQADKALYSSKQNGRNRFTYLTLGY